MLAPLRDSKYTQNAQNSELLAKQCYIPPVLILYVTGIAP